MKITDTIKMLEAILELHGDLSVQVASEGYGNLHPAFAEDFRIEDEWTDMFPAKKIGNKCLCLYKS